MLSAQDMRIIHRIMEHKGLVDGATRSDARKVFPNGDRRKRPVFWLTDKEVRRLMSEDALKKTPKGYVITPSLARRIRLGKDGAYGQHQDCTPQDIYIPAGVIRKADVNTRANALERLARKKDGQGQFILSPAEVEAGRRLAKDYALAGLGHVSTQNYMSAGADGGDRKGRQEDKILRSMTARTRIKAAEAAMGEGLDKAVIAVCCHDESLDSVERAEHWVKSSGLTILKLGLSRLVKLYGTEVGVRPQDSETSRRVKPL